MTESDLFWQEWDVILERREAAGLDGEWTPAAPAGAGAVAGNLVGLALSGGGLRSALFQRGLLETLADRGLLKYVDVSASVSGGGFAAGYMAALGQRVRAEAERDRLAGGDGRRNAHAGPNDREQSTLGRPPAGAGVDRLRDAGEYLNDPHGVAGRWLLGTLPVLAMFFCGLLALSAAAALIWRGADTVWFRDRLGRMGLDDFGSDLGAAFLPVVPCFFGWLAVQFAAGRRTGPAAAGWLTALPWAIGTLLCVPLWRAAGCGAWESWGLSALAAAAGPAVAAGRWVARRQPGAWRAADGFARVAAGGGDRRAAGARPPADLG